MSVLKGTNMNPAVVDDPVGRVSIQKQGTKMQKDALEKRLQEWTALTNTKLYHILMELCDPMIRHVGLEISRPITEYPVDMPLDKIMEIKAECRGALQVWQDIKYAPGSLRVQLDQLDELEKKEEERRKGPSELVKKKLSEYA